jgi:uncharacterized protein YqeY
MTDTQPTSYRQIVESDVAIPGYGTGARKDLKDAEKRNLRIFKEYEDLLATQIAAIEWIDGEIARLGNEKVDRIIIKKDAAMAVKQYQDRFGIKGVER